MYYEKKKKKNCQNVRVYEIKQYFWIVLFTYFINFLSLSFIYSLILDTDCIKYAMTDSKAIIKNLMEANKISCPKHQVHIFGEKGSVGYYLSYGDQIYF